MKKLFCAMICLLIVVPISSASEVNEKRLASAFIFNFMKQIEWQEESQKKNFVIAIFQDAELFNILQGAVTHKQVRNIPIKVITVNELREGINADVFVLPEFLNNNLTSIAASLRQSNTLLITSDSANKRDIMINLVFDQSLSKMMFEINKSNILFEGLQLSNKLLLLGGTEIDVATLYRETEEAMLATKERERKLTNLLENKLTELASATSELQQLARQTRLYKQDIKGYQSSLDKISSRVALQEEAIKTQEEAIKVKEALLNATSMKLKQSDTSLLKIQNKLAAALANLERQQGILKNSAIEQMAMQVRIEGNKKTLSQQKLLIQQNDILMNQKNQTISYQRITIFIIIAISCLLIFIFIKYYQINKKLSRTIKNLKSTQQQLVESEKMAALGGLVAGISHEINTPIGIGVTAASFLKDKIEVMSQQFKSGKISKSMFITFVNDSVKASNLLLNNLEKAGDLIASFKRISIDNSLDEVTQVNVYQVIKDTVDSIQFAHKSKNIKVEFKCSENVQTNTYSGILSQIVNNLMINAILHGFECLKSKNTILIQVTGKRDYYIVRFEDDGKGISKENLSNILEPFYTTKRGEGGSGLGLHIVYNLITEKLKSNLDYGSELNKGTWFEFKLYDLKKAPQERITSLEKK